MGGKSTVVAGGGGGLPGGGSGAGEKSRGGGAHRQGTDHSGPLSLDHGGVARHEARRAPTSFVHREHVVVLSPGGRREKGGRRGIFYPFYSPRLSFAASAAGEVDCLLFFPPPHSWIKEGEEDEDKGEKEEKGKRRGCRSGQGREEEGDVWSVALLLLVAT